MAFFKSFKKGLKDKSKFEKKFEMKARKIGSQVGSYVNREVKEIRSGLDARREKRMAVERAFGESLQAARIRAARQRAKAQARSEIRKQFDMRSMPRRSYDPFGFFDMSGNRRKRR